MTLHVAVSGGTSLIGEPLVHRLEGRGDRVTLIGRVQDAKALKGLDAFVHLGGPGVAGKRTPEFIAQLRSARVDDTARLVEYLAALHPVPRAFVLGSSTAFYGDRGETIVTESAVAGAGFLAELACSSC